jgi:hypothetical protein
MIHVHPIHKREHVRTLVRGQRLLVLRQHISHLLKSKPEFVRTDEFCDQYQVLVRQPVHQADEQAAQTPRDLFVVCTLHTPDARRVQPVKRTHLPRIVRHRL